MKKIKIKYILITLISFILFTAISVYAATILNGNEISYDNTNSKLTSTTVQDAIDELYTDAIDAKNKQECPAVYDEWVEPIKLKVGDYVKMTPTLSSYTIDKTYTGYPGTQTINPQELNLWRVLKINSDGTIELISEHVSSTTVSFSGKTGYQNLVGYLNVLANKYENSKYTIGSRHVGYNGQTEYITDTTALDSTTRPWTMSTSSTSNTVESLGGGDMLYEKDYNLIEEVLGTRVATMPGDTSGSYYWLASRHYGYSSATNWYYYGRYVYTSGSLLTGPLYRYTSSSFITYGTSNSIRPIVILKSGISYGTALGTSDDPYVLE